MATELRRRGVSYLEDPSSITFRVHTSLWGKEPHRVVAYGTDETWGIGDLIYLMTNEGYTAEQLQETEWYSYVLTGGEVDNISL